MRHVVIDTNVLAVSNGLATHVDTACVEACVERLVRAQRDEKVVLDVNGLILDEYHHHCTPWNPQRPGDQFLRWLLQVQGDPAQCERVTLIETGDPARPVEPFPVDPDLAGFDPDDHKFVATVLASEEQPDVLNAVDTDWRDFEEPLKRHDVEVQFLCPQHVTGAA